jgi:glutathione S-transferase
MIKLYVDSKYTSPYALSVFVALKEKQLDFSLIEVDLFAQAQHQDDYAATSLTQRVPTLVEGDFALSESSAITEYLEEAYPGKLLYPKGRHDRARARQIQAWLRSDLMPIREERSTETIFIQPTQEPLSIAAQASAQKLFSAATALLIHGGENLFGDWCLADVDLALMLNRLIANHDRVPDQLVAYVQHQWAHPAIAAWVAKERPMPS